MTSFFIRLKGWQLEALLIAAFLIPLAIHVFRFIALVGPDRETNGAVLITLFCQLCGFIIMLQVSISFSWQQATSRYLNNLLPGIDKDNPDYSLYTKFLFLDLFAGITGAVLFFTRYVFVLFFFALNHSWIFILFFILVVAMILLARRTFVFMYKAWTSLLTGTPYKSVEVNFFSTPSRAYLQNMIRQVYMKYGEC